MEYSKITKRVSDNYHEKMKNKICCIFNLAPIYRQSIFKLMDSELNCDFFITNWKTSPLKQMDYSVLGGFRGSGRRINLFKGFFWQTNTLNLIFKPYRLYILAGDPFSVSTWLILLFAKFFGKKTFLWSHGWYGRENKIKEVVKKGFFKLSTKVLLYGDYARNLMIDEGFTPEKLVCIYNSLDYEEQIKIRRSLRVSTIFTDHFNNDYPVLIYVGRIQKVKKIEMIFDALKLLNLEDYYCNLVIVGNDADGLNLKEIANNIMLSKQVWMFGACFSEEILGELIYNSCVCVSPGNIGLTAMHSLVYGTPVITQDNFKFQGPEFEAVIEGLTGSFFKEDSISDLCAKIKLWVGRNVWERENIRQNCYNVISDRYNPKVQIDVLKKVVNSEVVKFNSSTV